MSKDIPKADSELLKQADKIEALIVKLEKSFSETICVKEKGLPVWIRSPKVGTEYFSGFSRAKLYELAGSGLIRSVSIRDDPKASKGTRLFHLQSILDYVLKCEANTI